MPGWAKSRAHHPRVTLIEHEDALDERLDRLWTRAVEARALASPLNRAADDPLGPVAEGEGRGRDTARDEA